MLWKNFDSPGDDVLLVRLFSGTYPALFKCDLSEFLQFDFEFSNYMSLSIKKMF